MSDSRKIECDTHGLQDETFVCQHIVQGLAESTPYGFWWPESSDQARPDAWCTACNEVLAAEYWEWTEKAEKFASIKLLCGQCYDRARDMNLKPKRWWEFWLICKPKLG